jgi:hypothetical protein
VGHSGVALFIYLFLWVGDSRVALFIFVWVGGGGGGGKIVDLFGFELSFVVAEWYVKSLNKLNIWQRDTGK